MRKHLASICSLLMLIALVACQRQVAGAGAKVEQVQPPTLGGNEEGGEQAESTGAALGGGQEAVSVAEAAPPGLRIVNIKISPTTLGVRQSTGFKGFKNGDSSALVQLPLFGLDPRLGTYYLLVAVGNFGPAPVRNLKARADFLNADGITIWSETQALTHFPTRLGLNPPSLPNIADPQPNLGDKIKGFDLYYFPTNVGVFTYNVPDSAVSAQIKDWKLTFLVSTT
ncbi:MAG: hypothetical protein ABR507_11660 [Actinomycetota bacterium]|nr:hypothetical protein [Actinomycetota bacterium]